MISFILVNKPYIDSVLPLKYIRNQYVSWAEWLYYRITYIPIFVVRILGLFIGCIVTDVFAISEILRILYSKNSFYPEIFNTWYTDEQYVIRRFRDTFTVWPQKLDENSYVIDFSQDYLKKLYFTLKNKTYLPRCKSYFTNKKPIKIILYDDDDNEYVFKPGDHGWLIAKGYTDATTFQMNFIYHIIFNHRLSFLFAALMLKYLNNNHKIYILMSNHFEKVFNFLNYSSLIPSFETTIDIDYVIASLTPNSVRCFENRLNMIISFEDLNMLNKLTKNGFDIDDIPEYYTFAKYVTLILKAEKRFLTKTIYKIYPTEAELQEDTHINKLFNEFKDRIGIKIINDKLTRDSLIELLVTLVSLILEHSAEHSAACRSLICGTSIPFGIQHYDPKEIKHVKKEDIPTYYTKNVLPDTGIIFSQTIIVWFVSSYYFTTWFRNQNKFWGDLRSDPLWDKYLLRFQNELYEISNQADNDKYHEAINYKPIRLPISANL
jgi:hypothetical protein